MRLRLPELQDGDSEAQKIWSDGLTKDWEDLDEVLHRQGLPYVPKITRSELISRHHDDSLAGYFGIDKTQELIVRNYYWPTLRRDVEAYVKGCDVCLTSKAVSHKPYGDLRSLPVPTHRWKDLFMDFVIGLQVSFELERQELRLDTSHYQLAYKNGPLQAGKSHGSSSGCQCISS